MKTPEEILDSQSDVFNCWDGKMFKHLKVLAIEAMKTYANQKLDEAAEIYQYRTRYDSVYLEIIALKDEL